MAVKMPLSRGTLASRILSPLAVAAVCILVAVTFATRESSRTRHNLTAICIALAIFVFLGLCLAHGACSLARRGCAEWWPWLMMIADQLYVDDHFIDEYDRGTDHGAQAEDDLDDDAWRAAHDGRARLDEGEAPLRFDRPFAAAAMGRLSADAKATVDAGFRRLAGEESVATEAFVFDFVGEVHPSLPKRVGLLLGGCFESWKGRVDTQSFQQAAAIAHAGEALERLSLLLDAAARDDDELAAIAQLVACAGGPRVAAADVEAALAAEPLSRDGSASSLGGLLSPKGTPKARRSRDDDAVASDGDAARIFAERCPASWTDALVSLVASLDPLRGAWSAAAAASDFAAVRVEEAFVGQSSSAAAKDDAALQAPPFESSLGLRLGGAWRAAYAYDDDLVLRQRGEAVFAEAVTHRLFNEVARRSDGIVDALAFANYFGAFLQDDAPKLVPRDVALKRGCVVAKLLFHALEKEPSRAFLTSTEFVQGLAWCLDDGFVMPDQGLQMQGLQMRKDRGADWASGDQVTRVSFLVSRSRIPADVIRHAIQTMVYVDFAIAQPSSSFEGRFVQRARGAPYDEQHPGGRGAVWYAVPSEWLLQWSVFVAGEEVRLQADDSARDDSVRDGASERAPDRVSRLAESTRKDSGSSLPNESRMPPQDALSSGSPTLNGSVGGWFEADDGAVRVAPQAAQPWFSAMKSHLGFATPEDQSKRAFSALDCFQVASEDVPAQRPGPLDLRPLMVPSSRPEMASKMLRKDVILGQDYQLVRPQAWRTLVAWYGIAPGSKAVARRVAYDDFTLRLELFPAFVSVYVERAGAVEACDQVVVLTCSVFEHLRSIKKRVLRAAGMDGSKQRVRLWMGCAPTRRSNPPSVSQPPGACSPTVPLNPSALLGGDAVAILNAFAAKRLVDDSMLSRNLDECIASREVVLVVEVSDGLGRYARKRGAAAALKKIHYHEQHDVGLKNLGNTCYMNAVLQALVHVRAWREYFSSREYEFDVNREARFGAKGKLAVAFGKLVEELDVDFSRHENGASVGHDCVRAGVVEPRRFKRIVGAFAKRFQGQDQQDAAEFLAKLLEGFGEELNRVKGDKPYVEDKDDDDDERCAAAAWANHLRREDHAVTACFAGLVRNELVCAATKERKTAFEPFCSLVVPLPERRGAFVRVRVHYLRALRREALDATVKVGGPASSIKDVLRAVALLKFDGEGGLDAMSLVASRAQRSDASDDRKTSTPSMRAFPPLLPPAFRVRLLSRDDVLDVFEVVDVAPAAVHEDHRGPAPAASPFSGAVRVEARVPGGAWEQALCLDRDGESFDVALHKSIHKSIHRLPAHRVRRPGPALLRCVSRALVPAGGFHAGSKAPQMFGAPFFVRVLAGDTTGADLHRAVWAQLRPCVTAGAAGALDDAIREATAATVPDVVLAPHLDSPRRRYPFSILRARLPASGGRFQQNAAPLRDDVANPRLDDVENGVLIIRDDDHAAFEESDVLNATQGLLIDVPSSLRLLFDESLLATVTVHESLPRCASEATTPDALEDCLAAVARAETVTAHSRAATAKNGGTYTETQFVRSVHVWAAPPILVLTLRRFKVIAATGARYKLTNLVSFPLEGLVLPAALLACGSATYDVTAVINHTGSLQGGHYTCAARSLQAGKDEWLLFNDAAVTVVQDPGTTVVTAAAYVLFLTRRDVVESYRRATAPAAAAHARAAPPATLPSATRALPMRLENSSDVEAPPEPAPPTPTPLQEAREDAPAGEWIRNHFQRCQTVRVDVAAIEREHWRHTHAPAPAQQRKRRRKSTSPSRCGKTVPFSPAPRGDGRPRRWCESLLSARVCAICGIASDARAAPDDSRHGCEDDDDEDDASDDDGDDLDDSAAGDVEVGVRAPMRDSNL